MIPGILISLVCLAVVLYFVDFQSLADALRLADYRLVLAGIVVFLISLIARGLAWRTLLLERATLTQVLFAINEGYLLNNILPFRLGEVGRALLLGQASRLNFWQVFSTILVERVFDLGLSAGLLLATLPFVLGVDWAQQVAVIMATLVVVGLIALFLLARNRDWALGVYERFGARWPVVLRIGRERLEAFFVGLEALVNPRRFLLALGLMALVWSLTLLEYYLVLLAFLPSAPVLSAAFALGVVAMGVAVPSSPSFIGVFEASVVGALSVFGVDPSVGLAYAITIHLLFFIITAIFGVVGLARDGESLGQLYQRVRRANVVNE